MYGALRGFLAGGIIVLAVSAMSGCAAPGNAAGQAGTVTPSLYDRGNLDIDGDGDRGRIAGFNDVNNPGVDVRSMTSANAVGDVTAGRYPGVWMADRVADVAGSAPGVDAAFAVVSGRTAIIGVDLVRSIRPVNADQVVREVRKRVLVQAPGFLNVHITADRRLTSQIDHIREGLRTGRPLSVYDPDLQRLVRQIPAIPPYYSGYEEK